MQIVRLVVPWVSNLGSPGFRRFVVKLIPWRKLQYLREMVDVIEQTSLEVLKEKKRVVGAGGDASDQLGHGNDLISILSTSNLFLTCSFATKKWHLVKANSQGFKHDKLPESELLACVYIRASVSICTQFL